MSYVMTGGVWSRSVKEVTTFYHTSQQAKSKATILEKYQPFLFCLLSIMWLVVTWYEEKKEKLTRAKGLVLKMGEESGRN
jgi:hypothetical protein